MNPRSRSRSPTGLRLGPQVESRLRSGEWNSWGAACGGGGCAALEEVCGKGKVVIISRVWRGEQWEWGRLVSLLVSTVDEGTLDEGFVEGEGPVGSSLLEI